MKLDVVMRDEEEEIEIRVLEGIKIDLDFSTREISLPLCISPYKDSNLDSKSPC